MDINFKDVVLHICDYFEEHLSLYTVFEVRKQSYNPDDDYLYMVAAKHQNGSYAVWISWNENTQSLNHGYYGLSDMKTCAEIMLNYQSTHNTDETEYTPLKCLQELLIKHDDNLEDSYQQIVYVTGFIDGITAQRENNWYEISEADIDELYHEAVEE